VDELTYSVVAPEAEPRVAGGIMESYRRLSAALVLGLERLGVADVVADQRAENHNAEGPVCFEVPSDYEITVGGRKLVGSAQMRGRGMVLQHGTLPLCGDIARVCMFLAAHPDPARVHARATTVEEALGWLVSWDEAADAVAAGFTEALNLYLAPGSLTDEERAWAQGLRAEKHAAAGWVERV
jgi:lipoate-protein ligase A